MNKEEQHDGPESDIRQRAKAQAHYEEVIELDEQSDEQEVSVLRGYYNTIYVFLMICMFSLLVIAVITERTNRRKPWTAEDKQVLFVMVTFVFHTPISSLVCFLVSVFVYTCFTLLRRKEQAYKMLKYYPIIHTSLESKFLIVCFVLGIKYIIADTFYNDLYHEVFFVAMLILCVIVFAVNVSWFFARSRPTSRQFTQRMDGKDDAGNPVSLKFRTETHNYEADREEVKGLLDHAADAITVDQDKPLITPIEGIKIGTGPQY